MSWRRIPGFVVGLLCAAVPLAWAPIGSGAQSAASSDADAHSVPVYISDFELAAADAKTESSKGAAAAGVPQKKPLMNATASSATQAKSRGVFLESDTPSVQARRLIDFFALTLSEILQKNGYTAKRWRGVRPESGAMLRGVFTEIDPLNRIHRAIQGGTAPGTKYTLYVGTFNLARPDLPLYAPAFDQAPDERFGPLITPNNYVPMAKYELDKHPTEEDVRKICAQIADGLTQLLAANPAAFGE
jgi:hypothetical protein